MIDGANNRRSVSRDGSGGTSTEAFTINVMNEYEAVGSVSLNHDDNGNRTRDANKTLVFDFRNRIVGISDRATGRPIACYLYLADSRRVVKEVYSATTPGQLERATAYFYDGWRVCEERDAGSGATLVTYVWGTQYIDELCQVERTASHPLGAARLWVHQNVRFDVVAVTNASGQVLEKRRYTDYGEVEFRDATGAVVDSSPSGVVFGFQGRRLDEESRLYYHRNRYYDPTLGRFVSRDPIGLWGDSSNLGNAQNYCASDPVNRVDPFGLDGCVCGWCNNCQTGEAGARLPADAPRSEWRDRGSEGRPVDLENMAPGEEKVRFSEFAENVVEHKEEILRTGRTILLASTGGAVGGLARRVGGALLLSSLTSHGSPEVAVVGAELIAFSHVDPGPRDAFRIPLPARAGPELPEVFRPSTATTSLSEARATLAETLSQRVERLLARSGVDHSKGPLILVDENMPVTVAMELRDRGFNAIHVIDEVGLAPGTADQEILSVAKHLRAMVLTRDKGAQGPALGEGFFDAITGTNYSIRIDARIHEIDNIADVIEASGICPSPPGK